MHLNHHNLMAVGLLTVSLIGGGILVAHRFQQQDAMPIVCATEQQSDPAERHWGLYKTASSAQLNPLTAPPREYEGTFQATILEKRGIRTVCVPLDVNFRVCAIYDMINNDGVRILGQVRDGAAWRTEFNQSLVK